jgi:heme/copper-type cytochrome/quinol oxidase subunit 3
MSLHPRRTVAYAAGACAGGFTTAAVVAARRREPRAAGRWLALAVLAGALSVVAEESAPD